jgi:hypothetical protein
MRETEIQAISEKVQQLLDKKAELIQHLCRLGLSLSIAPVICKVQYNIAFDRSRNLQLIYCL